MDENSLCKQLLASVALAVVTNFVLVHNLLADTQPLEIVGVEFVAKAYPDIKLKILNTSGNSIVAWRGELHCFDAFGDLVIEVDVISRSANLEPDRIQEFDRTLGINDPRAAAIVLKNDAKNFQCELKKLEIVSSQG